MAKITFTCSLCGKLIVREDSGQPSGECLQSKQSNERST